MTAPLISVSMLTYNHAPYIVEAIEGVLKQKTQFSFELVIGEDCSTDGTREIVLKYQQRYPDIIRVITSDLNIGMKRNGLRALDACKGKYIAFCEGDDYWHDACKLEKQAIYMESHPQCGMVFTDYDFYYEGLKKRVHAVNQSKGFYSNMNLDIRQVIGSEGGLIRTCTVMGRSNLISQIMTNDPYLHQNAYFLMGDTQLFAELTLVSDVSYYPESMATYRIHGESATRSKDQGKTARFWISASEMKLYLCDKHRLSGNIRTEFESDWCDNALRLAFHTRNSELADEVRRKAPTFSLTEWLRYYGAKYAVFYYIYHGLTESRNLIMRR